MLYFGLCVLCLGFDPNSVLFHYLFESCFYYVFFFISYSNFKCLWLHLSIRLLQCENINGFLLWILFFFPHHFVFTKNCHDWRVFACLSKYWWASDLAFFSWKIFGNFAGLKSSTHEYKLRILLMARTWEELLFDFYVRHRMVIYRAMMLRILR